MATKDRNGALHSEKNGRFVSNGGANPEFDVSEIRKQPSGRFSSIVPGKNEQVKIPFDYFGGKSKKSGGSLEIPPAPKEAFGFYDKHKWTTHFEKHNKDFGYKDEKSYNKGAIDFWNNSPGKVYYMVSSQKICKLGTDGLTICVCEKSGDVNSYYKFKNKKQVDLYKKMYGWRLMNE